MAVKPLIVDRRRTVSRYQFTLTGRGGQCWTVLVLVIFTYFIVSCMYLKLYNYSYISITGLFLKPGIYRVQALADISHLALCYHSNETRALIANPLDSAHLEGIHYHSPKLHPGPCSSVGMRQGTDTQIATQMAMTTIHFASAVPHAKCH